MSLVVRGYHVYRTLWEPFLGEEFVVLHEADNDCDGLSRNGSVLYS